MSPYNNGKVGENGMGGRKGGEGMQWMGEEIRRRKRPMNRCQVSISFQYLPHTWIEEQVNEERKHKEIHRVGFWGRTN